MAVLLVEADFSQFAIIRQFVLSVSTELGLDDAVVCDLQLVTEEICTNVIEHGYGDQEGEIELRMELVPEGVQVIVRDWAEPFDPETVPVPDVTAPLHERQLGGLGLYLVHRLMDEVAFEFDAEQGNTLTMLKRL